MVRKEVFSLYLIQISNVAIPLLVFPYFTRVLGVEGVGKIGFAQTIFMLSSFLIDFGFNLSGAKNIGVLNNLKKNFDHLYSNIQIFRFLIYCFLSIISFVILVLFPMDKDDQYIVFIAVLASLGNVIIPNFLFNALSINSKLAVITLIIRILFLLPIFIFVKTKSDFMVAISLQLLPNILVGIVAQYYVTKKIDINFSFYLFDKLICVNQVKEAYHNFSASFFTLGFTYSIPLLVKFFLGDYALGIYTMVDKLINLMRQMYIPVIQGFYTKVCICYESKDWLNYRNYLKKILIIFSVIGLFALFFNYLFGEWAVSVIFGKVENLKHYLNIAIANQIIISIAIILVNFYILPSNNAYILKRIYAIAFLIFMPVFYILQKSLQLDGVFYSIQLIEILITLSFICFLYYRNSFKSKIDNEI